MSELLDEVSLARIEREHPEGLTSQQILALLEGAQINFSEASLRKYVQLGLLPRSVRVGRKGKHQGSQGFYPASVVRQIVRIRAMMAQNYTIEQIQKEFLFVRGEIEELERLLSKIFQTLDGSLAEAGSEPVRRALLAELAGARASARDLTERLTSIEGRLVTKARVERAVGLGRAARFSNYISLNVE
jgi:hypothetical protein